MSFIDLSIIVPFADTPQVSSLLWDAFLLQAIRWNMTVQDGLHQVILYGAISKICGINTLKGLIPLGLILKIDTKNLGSHIWAKHMLNYPYFFWHMCVSHANLLTDYRSEDSILCLEIRVMKCYKYYNLREIFVINPYYYCSNIMYLTPFYFSSILSNNVQRESELGN